MKFCCSFRNRERFVSELLNNHDTRAARPSGTSICSSWRKCQPLLQFVTLNAAINVPFMSVHVVCKQIQYNDFKPEHVYSMSIFYLEDML